MNKSLVSLSENWKYARATGLVRMKPGGTVLRLFCMMFVITLFGTPEEKSMVYIGNSFTFYHSLPNIVTALIEEGRQGLTVKNEIVGYGGRSLFQHWDVLRSYDRLKASTLSEEQWESEIAALKELSASKDAPKFYLDYYTKMAEDSFWKSCFPWVKMGDWNKDRSLIDPQAVTKLQNWKKMGKPGEKIDYVVLQSWQDVTESMDIGYWHYAGLFTEVIRSRGSKPVLYLTAPNNQNAAPVAEAVRKEEVLKTCRLSKEAEKKFQALVVPVPLALMLAQESDEPVARTLTFRFEKDFHPNTTMAYLTACVFYSVLMERSPEGLKLNTIGSDKPATIHGEAITAANKSELFTDKVDADGKPKVRILEDAARIFLQRMAWSAVEKYRKGEF